MGMLCLFVALAWTGTQALMAMHAWQSLLQAREANARVEPRPSRMVQTKGSAPDVQKNAQVDAVVRYLATPWPAWFGALERHANGQTLIKRMEWDAKGALKATARSPDTDAMVAYITALQKDPSLRDVSLLRQETQRIDPKTPVQFELSAGPMAQEGGLAVGTAAGDSAVSLPAGALPRPAP